MLVSSTSRSRERPVELAAVGAVGPASSTAPRPANHLMMTLASTTRLDGSLARATIRSALASSQSRPRAAGCRRRLGRDRGRARGSRRPAEELWPSGLNSRVRIVRSSASSERSWPWRAASARSITSSSRLRMVTVPWLTPCLQNAGTHAACRRDQANPPCTRHSRRLGLAVHALAADPDCRRPRWRPGSSRAGGRLALGAPPFGQDALRPGRRHHPQPLAAAAQPERRPVGHAGHGLDRLGLGEQAQGPRLAGEPGARAERGAGRDQRVARARADGCRPAAGGRRGPPPAAGPAGRPGGRGRRRRRRRRDRPGRRRAGRSPAPRAA